MKLQGPVAKIPVGLTLGPEMSSINNPERKIVLVKTNRRSTDDVYL